MAVNYWDDRADYLTGGSMGSNPFMSAMRGAAGSAPMAMPTSPAMMRPGNPLTASDGPLASQMGVLGSILFGRNPSRQDMSNQQFGGAQAGVAAKMQELVAQGIPPQQAIMQIMQAPEGQQFMASGGDMNALINMAKLAQPAPVDQTPAIRDAWSGLRAKGTQPPAAMASPVNPTSDMGLTPEQQRLDAAFANQGVASRQTPPLGIQQPALMEDEGLTPEDYMDTASELAQLGTPESLDQAKVAIQLAEQARQARSVSGTPVTTDRIKNYTAYYNQTIAEGKNPIPFGQWDPEIAAKSAAELAANGGKPKLYEYVIKDIGTRQGEIDALMQEESLLEQATNTLTGLQTGAITQITQPIRSMLYEMGIDIGNVPQEQLAQTITSQLALRMRDPSTGAGMPGPMSDADRTFVVAAQAGIGMSPEANEAILLQRKAVNRRLREVKEAEINYLEENNGRSGWDKRRKELFTDEDGKSKPLFTAEEEKRMQQLLTKAGLWQQNTSTGSFNERAAEAGQKKPASSSGKVARDAPAQPVNPEDMGPPPADWMPAGSDGQPVDPAQREQVWRSLMGNPRYRELLLKKQRGGK